MMFSMTAPPRNTKRKSLRDRLVRLLVTSLAAVAPIGVSALEAPSPVRRAAAQVDAVLFYGQSNAGAGGTAKAVLTAPVVDTAITFKTLRQVYGSAEIDPAQLEGLGPLTDNPLYAPFPATAMGIALARMSGRPSRDRASFFHTIWYGSQPISSFLPGTTSWADLLIVARRMTDVVGRTGGTARVSALVFIQGESGPSDRTAYAASLTTLLDAALPALRGETGQNSDVVAFLMQTNAPASGTKTRNDSDLAQAAIAAERPRDVVLAGPMYQLPLADNIHQTAEGRMMLGELLARAYARRVLQGKPFQPLHPTRAMRQGRTISIRFHRPEGGLPLRWDTTWIAAAPHYGFAVESAGGEVAISSVAITDPDTVTVTLADDPTGPVRLLYAQGQPSVPGWASGRGQLVSDSAIPSVFQGMGYKVPRTIGDYSIRFILDVPAQPG